jgi:hypothetical protein
METAQSAVYEERAGRNDKAKINELEKFMHDNFDKAYAIDKRRACEAVGDSPFVLFPNPTCN